MKNIIISCEKIHYKYPDGTYALKGLNINIEKGKKIGILGPNGAGKTTLFFHLNGLYKPDYGKIYFEGKEVVYDRKNLKYLRSKVGIVFQDSDAQLFSSSVYEEISFGIMNLNLPKNEVKKRIDYVITKLKIENLVNRPTHFLSGGEKKKVAIASILAMSPEVIILDEPLANVDSKASDEIIEILNQLNSENKTIIISSHNPDNIYSWADYIYVLYDGNILGEGTPYEIFSNDKLMEIANVKKPIILEFYEKLRDKYPEIKNKYGIPKNKNELFKIIELI
ncbi:energy-coupling factor ABC transporter ATP-binding protein [Caloranaerobacter azorensis]|uniref:ABC transporter ATP-binding protein n=1 Tax=Caloranaerobacter azorensis TaxID=116090 RepID=A0A6P1YCI9_9FIRM|nr:ATP-binding cassette domain-containing protein [Caloranaerobacter azorensis]QIB26443.1 ATP-binding cassette domain-containing protein [Caloranaerobacter azorensis]